MARNLWLRGARAGDLFGPRAGGERPGAAAQPAGAAARLAAGLWAPGCVAAWLQSTCSRPGGPPLRRRPHRAAQQPHATQLTSVAVCCVAASRAASCTDRARRVRVQGLPQEHAHARGAGGRGRVRAAAAAGGGGGPGGRASACAAASGGAAPQRCQRRQASELSGGRRTPHVRLPWRALFNGFPLARRGECKQKGAERQARKPSRRAQLQAAVVRGPGVRVAQHAVGLLHPQKVLHAACKQNHTVAGRIVNQRRLSRP